VLISETDSPTFGGFVV